MFTGIVEDLGEVEAVEHLGDFARIHVRSAVVTQDARPGDSICVNGVCLTVTGLIAARPAPAGARDSSRRPADRLHRRRDGGDAPALQPQVRQPRAPRSTWSARSASRTGSAATSSRATPTARPPSSAATPSEDWEVVRIGLPAGLARYVVHKGSIAVDGVSLTVSAIGDDWFEVSLIPETLKRTTLGIKQPGAEVNLEVDVIAKYVEKPRGPMSSARA